MTDVLDFHDIAQESKGAMNGGRLKLSKQGITFKNSKTGKVDQVHAEDVEKTNWLRVARGYELKLYTNNGGIYKYDGFKDADKENVAKFLKTHFDLELEETDLSLKGWNWGTATFKGSELAFAVDNKPAFHLPLGNVSHTTTAKNEVILEFHQNDDAEVSLMEMRFYVPPTEADANPVEQFHENILAKADIIQATGDAICTIEQIPCLTPRGRYDLKIFPTFLQFHGKTFDYKIPFTTVLRLFLLPHKDNRQMFFVLSLDPPIVQGLTRYHFLILSFNKEDEDMSLELNLSEEDLQEKYQGKLQKEMTGASYELISRLMKSLTSRKITIPGSFQTLNGAKAINCSYKSNSGFLYPLERGFMFVHKPPIHIRFDEIACVNFSRGTGSSRYFDFEIETRNGSTYVFSTIDKNEYGPLFDFVSNKKLRVKNRNMKGSGKSYDGMENSDDENAHDAYLEQVKQEGRQKEEEDVDYDMNDEDDESDEDFNPDIIEASDVELEYDSNASESSDSDGDFEAATGEESEREEGELKPKRHKEKKAKRSKTVSENPRKRRKHKKDEDPNKPKRNPSAYMMWLNENREDIKKQVPEGSGVAEVAKKAGMIWNDMETETKANWQDKASEAKKVYQVAMTEYTRMKAAEQKDADSGEEEEESHTPEKKRKKSKKESKKKVSPSPKKAGTGSGFKSKEYISDSDSSSDEDKKKKNSKKGKKVKTEKEESEKEESEKEEEAAGSEEEAASEKEESEKEASEAESEAAEESD